jgi:pimeloyl-ACP methyl ester carboxylesterase
LVAGESYGGYLARGLAAKRPEQVDGLLLICPVGEPEPSKRSVAKLQVFEIDEALLASLSEDDRVSLTSINVLQNRRMWERISADILPGLKLADYPLWDRTILPKYTFSFPIDLTDEPYDKPSLFLMGRQDVYVGYHDQWQFIEAYPHASYAVLDRAGHNLQIEQDVVLNTLVIEWLERVKGRNLFAET